MTPDDRVDAALEDLRSALDVRPSPEFAARVRARVAAESAARPSRVGWWGLALVGLAAMVVAVVWMRWPVQDVVPEPARQAVVMPPAVTPAPARAPLPSVESAAPRAGAPRQATRVAPTAVIPDAQPRVGAAFEVLVPPDQAIAVNRLLAAMLAGRSLLPPAPPPVALANTFDEAQPPAIVIEPVTIAPISQSSSGSIERERENP